MTNEMRALVKAAPEVGLRMETRPVPEIGPDDVLIRVRKTGICGTDIHIWQWDDWAAAHGPGPARHRPRIRRRDRGDRAQRRGPQPRPALFGRRPPDRQDLPPVPRGQVPPRPRNPGDRRERAGAFADYLRLPAFNVVPLPDSIDDEIGAILDPLGNAVHTALSFDLLGEDVLVTGAGPIGIMAAAVARHAGARHVVITDVNPDRLSLAGQVADVRPVDVTREDLKDVIKELGMKQGFDVGLEMSGNQAALDQMVEHLVMGGRIALLGIPPGRSPVDWSRIVFKAITIKGVYGREIFETWYKMIAMLENGLDVRRVITHRFRADDFATGFEAMLSGKSGKVVLDWT
jgi:threonine 3-dehydrogenase